MKWQQVLAKDEVGKKIAMIMYDIGFRKKALLRII